MRASPLLHSCSWSSVFSRQPLCVSHGGCVGDGVLQGARALLSEVSLVEGEVDYHCFLGGLHVLGNEPSVTCCLGMGHRVVGWISGWGQRGGLTTTHCLKPSRGRNLKGHAWLGSWPPLFEHPAPSTWAAHDSCPSFLRVKCSAFPAAAGPSFL